jgi:hypothetical protein
MGVDFISKANESYRKGRKRERERLETELVISTDQIRTILVRPTAPSSIQEGCPYELEVRGADIIVYQQDGQAVGVCKNAPQSIVDELNKFGGIALGSLHGVREISGQVDIEVSLK